MSLAPYTTNDDVRGVLGLSNEELVDETLRLSIYELNLVSALKKVGANILTDFGVVVDISPATRTATQAAFHDALVLYAPYAVALQLGGALPLIAPKLISDGKASMSRFSEAPFQQMLGRLQVDHDRYLNDLIEAYAGYSGSTVNELDIPNLFQTSVSAIDRVTDAARA